MTETAGLHDFGHLGVKGQIKIKDDTHGCSLGALILVVVKEGKIINTAIAVAMGFNDDHFRVSAIKLLKVMRLLFFFTLAISSKMWATFVWTRLMGHTMDDHVHKMENDVLFMDDLAKR